MAPQNEPWQVCPWLQQYCQHYIQQLSACSQQQDSQAAPQIPAVVTVH